MFKATSLNTSSQPLPLALPSLNEAELLLPLAQAARLFGLSQGVLRHLLPQSAFLRQANTHTRLTQAPFFAEGFIPLKSLPQPSASLFSPTQPPVKPLASPSLKGIPALAVLSQPTGLSLGASPSSKVCSGATLNTLPAEQCFQALLQHWRLSQ